MADDAELERFKAQRVTAIHRLDLIARGARITYEDGTPVDMASERQRLEDVVADMDRRITAIEQRMLLTATRTDDRITRH
jgi:hypothetical protein